MKAGSHTLDSMRALLGQEVGLTDWLPVEQKLIDGFAAATLDPEWLHIDVERAARESPYGGTIAFGFWTLSLLTYFSHQIGLWPADVKYGLNYGLDRVRWISPLRVGSRIRNRAVLTSWDDKGDDRILFRTRNTIEIEGEAKPALVADWLGLFVR